MYTDLQNRFVYSELDSNRFQMRIFRAYWPDVNVAALTDFFNRHHPDMIIARLPAENQHQLYLLDQAGVCYLVADTIVYYHKLLINGSSDVMESVDDLNIVCCTSEQREVLGDLAQNVFNGYHSHYHANPFFDHAKILQGYRQWASRCVTCPTDQTICWLAQKNDTVCGFIACHYDIKTQTAEIILNGVHPDYRRQGIYRALLRHVQWHFEHQGYRKLIISTQVHNYKVQSVWIHEGFVIKQAYVTLHITGISDTGGANIS